MSAQTHGRVDNVARHAETLVDLLVDCGPLTKDAIVDKLGWRVGRLPTALRFAREQLCPELGLTIPTATPPDWLYQVTMDWKPVETGAAYAMGMAESRLAGVARDVRIVLPALAKGTTAWRRANFLNKHLDHLLATLAEIR
jgi:hypothetical protein